MKTSRLIKNFMGDDRIDIVVSQEALRDALDLYEASLDIIVKNPPRDENSNIPGMREFNICHDIIQVYYEQNPGFTYHQIREGFTPEQITTLMNIEGDKQAFENLQRHKFLKRVLY